MARILTAVVLYRMQAEKSPAFRSFCAALQRSAELRELYRFVVFDNSPDPQVIPPGYAEAYVHDPANPGLAKPYSLALQRAEEAGIGWLMVLDQDTIITSAYLEEAAALAKTQAPNEKIVALVPKLVQDGVVQSPHTLLGLRPTQPIALDRTGPAAQELHAFNSGAVLRVATLQTAGGFPSAYPLDFLDHATFRTLQRSGGRVYLMASKLEHELSLLELYRDNLPEVPERMRHVFETEVRFYREMGKPREQFLHRLRLVVRAIKGLRAGAYRRALLFLKLAITFRP